MRKLIVFALLAVVALPVAARAAEEVAGAKSSTKAGKPYFEASEKTTEQATVLRVETASRYVTLKGPHGDTLRVKAGAEVKNFAQIKAGDRVNLTYTERLTIHVEAAGTPEMVTETVTGAAKLGAKPAGSVTERTQYKATIAAIDTANGTATLRGYDNEEFVVTPLHPENLLKVSIGEMVVFTHTEGVAVSVEKVVAKKK